MLKETPNNLCTISMGNPSIYGANHLYIATINTENYDAMVQSLSPEVKQELDASVVL